MLEEAPAREQVTLERPVAVEPSRTLLLQVPKRSTKPMWSGPREGSRAGSLSLDERELSQVAGRRAQVSPTMIGLALPLDAAPQAAMRTAVMVGAPTS